MRSGDARGGSIPSLDKVPDLVLGDAVVRPSLLMIVRGDQSVKLEPLVMALLVALKDGQPLGRDALIEQCWGRRVVTDDAIGRAVGKLRSAARELGDPFRIETVSKLGYRLVVDAREPAPVFSGAAKGASRLSRRQVVGVAALGMVVPALGVWQWRATQTDPTLRMIEEAGVALKQGLPESNERALALLQEAVKRRAQDPLAWGRLAIAWRDAAEFGPPSKVAAAVANAEVAARQALALDPRQSEGLAALATLTPLYGDWGPTERRLRDVLAVDAANFFASAALAKLYMSTGQVRASEQLNRQLIERDPLSPDRLFRQIYLLWSLAKLNEMDLVAERALHSWPLHPGVWFARLWTLLYTGRAPEAWTMLDRPNQRPSIPPPAIALFRLSISAIGGWGDRDEAVAAHFAAAQSGPQIATTAIMTLAKLHALDEAYSIANAYLLNGGTQWGAGRQNPTQAVVPDMYSRMTMFLFTPVMREFRSNSRYEVLCEDIGLAAYWSSKEIVPDF